MKKNYFMLAATAALFAACAETDLVNEIVVEETPQAIGFDAFANKTTRAEITDIDDLKTNEGGFHVWGYKSTDRWLTSYTVFDNIPVSWVAPVRADDGSVTKNGYWTYDVPQYWDKTATYEFYAAAPKSSNYSISNKLITVNNVTSGKSSDVTDYLIDRNGVTNVNGALKQPVQFEFNHIMSKISFKFKSGVNASDKINITSLTMTGWNNGSGKFVQNATAVPNAPAHSEWSIDQAGQGSCVIIDEDNEVSNITSSTAVAGGYSYIMVPQTITYTEADLDATPAVQESGLTFTISYEIVKSNTDTEVFTNQIGILPTTQTWGTDTHTTYTIIVSPTKIEFGDPTIQGWSVEDGDGDDDDDDDDTARTEDTLPL